jgi:UDP-glucuronate 4-epimerase
MTILVTGAAGFVGAHLVKALHSEGEKVIALDNFNDYYSNTLKHLRVSELVSPEVEVIELDLVDRNKLSGLMSKIKPKTVYHLAAQAGVRVKIEETERYVNSNLVGFSNILEQSVSQKVDNFLFASSSSVYGNSRNSPFREMDTSIIPISFYGATKLSNEYLARSLVRGTATKARGLRFFTVYGPWGRPDMAYFRIANSLINQKTFQLFGNGNAIRDFTYIDDVTKATYQLGKELSSRSERGYFDIVNIGGGSPHSMKDLIKEIEIASNQKLQIEYLDKIDRDVNLTTADPSYLKTLTKFAPQISLQNGIQSFIKWAEEKAISSELNSWNDSVQE